MSGRVIDLSGSKIMGTLSFSSLVVALIFNQIDPIFWLGFIGAIILLIITLTLSKYEHSETSEKESEKFKKYLTENGFDISQFHLTNQNGYCDGIALDETNKKIAMYSKFIHHNEAISKIINFEDIVEVKLIEDNVTVTKTSRGSQLGGALVGGALAGGVGAVIGGLSASSTSEEKVESIKLEIVVDSLTNPVYSVQFLNEILPIYKYEQNYKEHAEKANHWYRVTSVIVSRNEKNVNERTSN